MQVEDLPLEGLKLITLNVYGDSRGFFVERFNKRAFAENGLPHEFVQDNHSRSAPGVIRGLHFQVDPFQGKLVGVTKGHILDVVVDIRKNSKTFGQYFAEELTAENGKLLWIPAGFAHGFCVLGEDRADVMYKVDCFYAPEKEFGIMYNDPKLNIPWPVEKPIISARDQGLLSFDEAIAKVPLDL